VLPVIGDPELGEVPWWPVALTEDVIVGKPTGVFVDEEPIVLFRDARGKIRALENRCPHRRAPLSLGTVRAEGWLQCGYHGWSFDGATGRCKAIPNLRDDEPVPSTYGVFAYCVAEQAGLIYVSTSKVTEGPPEPLHAARSADRPAGIGRHIMGLSHSEYIAALMDGPHLMLDCFGMRIAQTMAIDPHWDNGWLIMERPAFWTGQSKFDAFVREYKLLFRLAVRRDSGESRLAFVLPDGRVIATAHCGITPSARGTTAVMWRARTAEVAGWRPTLLRGAAALGRAPLAPAARIDMAAVSRLLVGPSEYWPRDRRPGLFGDILTTRRAI
jgi:nitrite reductase/ring-hydroxylating ferredoxin subunit